MCCILTSSDGCYRHKVGSYIKSHFWEWGYIALFFYCEKVLRNYEFDNIVLVQATSPLLQASDLDRGFEAFNEDEVDSVLSVVRQKRFHWGNDENGFAHPSNYDVFHRPRRQERRRRRRFAREAPH